MSQYYMLIKNNLISFDKLMIDKYNQIGLNETDAIILIKLNGLLNEGITKLESKYLEPSMSITNNTISKRIVDLVKNGYISLSLSNIDASEEFKNIYVNCKKEDIGIIKSPVGLPGRAILNDFTREIAAGHKKPFTGASGRYQRLSARRP